MSFKISVYKFVWQKVTYSNNNLTFENYSE